MDQTSPNFIYAIILTRAKSALLPIIFAHLYQSYAIYLLQNFVSAQYLENKWTDFGQTLYNYLYWQDLR